MPPKIIDSHIHLWPSSAASTSGHSWMTPGAHLTREYNINDYLTASSSLPAGFVYVETDRALPPIPAGPPDAITDDQLRTYAAEPLRELAFLRGIVEGDGFDAQGSTAATAHLLKGIVAWAPVQLGPGVLRRYLREAEAVAGERTWGLVKGFRFLLQGVRDEVVLGEAWLGGLAELGKGGWRFDIGVDQRGTGVWQVEAVGEMVRRVREREEKGSETVFVLNHFCKPDFEGGLRTDEQKVHHERWRQALEDLARIPGVYMKLSGAFSELGNQDESSPWPASEVADRMKPWLDVVFENFGPRRIMFGSDWPVCNVGGPGDGKSFKSWHAVVEEILNRRNLSEGQKVQIWASTATEAYGLGE